MRAQLHGAPQHPEGNPSILEGLEESAEGVVHRVDPVEDLEGVRLPPREVLTAKTEEDRPAGEVQVGLPEVGGELEILDQSFFLVLHILKGAGAVIIDSVVHEPSHQVVFHVEARPLEGLEHVNLVDQVAQVVVELQEQHVAVLDQVAHFRIGARPHLRVLDPDRELGGELPPELYGVVRVEEEGLGRAGDQEEQGEDNA